jgi:3-methyladenine DNA glycosylase AlkD
MTGIITEEIRSHYDEKYAAHHAKYFQTHKGGYGEGDIFWGLKIGKIHAVVKKHWKEFPLNDLPELLASQVHEVRNVGLEIMCKKMPKASDDEKKQIYDMYMSNIDAVNNWDLVDSSAPDIVGSYLYGKDCGDIWLLAKSGILWRERISVVATLYFIKRGDYALTVELSEHFIGHKHDLIHKACGWTLREIGKKDKETLIRFLEKHASRMPRTMLRYSLEKLSPEERSFYMRRTG